MIFILTLRTAKLRFCMIWYRIVRWADTKVSKEPAAFCLRAEQSRRRPKVPPKCRYLKKAYKYKMMYPLISILPSVLLVLSALICSASLFRKVSLMQDTEADTDMLFRDSSAVSGARPISLFWIYTILLHKYARMGLSFCNKSLNCNISHNNSV